MADNNNDKPQNKKKYATYEEYMAAQPDEPGLKQGDYLPYGLEDYLFPTRVGKRLISRVTDKLSPAQLKKLRSLVQSRSKQAEERVIDYGKEKAIQAAARKKAEQEAPVIDYTKLEMPGKKNTEKRVIEYFGQGQMKKPRRID